MERSHKTPAVARTILTSNPPQEAARPDSDATAAVPGDDPKPAAEPVPEDPASEPSPAVDPDDARDPDLPEPTENFPTPMRLVLVHSRRFRFGPYPALVTASFGNALANLSVFPDDANEPGVPVILPLSSVTVYNPLTDANRKALMNAGIELWAEWGPYQAGQARKTEDVAEILGKRVAVLEERLAKATAIHLEPLNDTPAAVAPVPAPLELVDLLTNRQKAVECVCDCLGEAMKVLVAACARELGDEGTQQIAGVLAKAQSYVQRIDAELRANPRPRPIPDQPPGHTGGLKLGTEQPQKLEPRYCGDHAMPPPGAVAHLGCSPSTPVLSVDALARQMHKDGCKDQLEERRSFRGRPVAPAPVPNQDWELLPIEERRRLSRPAALLIRAWAADQTIAPESRVCDEYASKELPDPLYNPMPPSAYLEPCVYADRDV